MVEKCREMCSRPEPETIRAGTFEEEQTDTRKLAYSLWERGYSDDPKANYFEAQRLISIRLRESRQTRESAEKESGKHVQPPNGE